MKSICRKTQKLRNKQKITRGCLGAVAGYVSSSLTIDQDTS